MAWTGERSVRDRQHPTDADCRRAYGLSGQSDQELAAYQSLMERYPGASRLSQATYHLRRGDKDQARHLLDEALARDERDGSLGSDRESARTLRARLGAASDRKSSNSP